MLTATRDWCKYIKLGYARATHLASIDIRQDRITREYGMKLIDEFEGFRPASLDYFLDIMDLTEQEFNEILAALSVPPYIHDFKKDIIMKKKVSDQDQWDASKNIRE